MEVFPDVVSVLAFLIGSSWNEAYKMIVLLTVLSPYLLVVIAADLTGSFSNLG